VKNIFDWLKQINYQKAPVESFSDKDWELFNSYMIHRFMSMNRDFIEVVNYVQELPPQEKRMIYNVYKEFIPKNNKWNKYIKSKNKQPNIELLKLLSEYWECSQQEAKQYKDLLENDQILSILSQIGVQPKEIKELTK
jgi:hypothetical protein